MIRVLLVEPDPGWVRVYVDLDRRRVYLGRVSRTDAGRWDALPERGQLAPFKSMEAAAGYLLQEAGLGSGPRSFTWETEAP